MIIFTYNPLNKKAMNEIERLIGNLSNTNEVSALYGVLKNKLTELDRKFSSHFNLDEEVKFKCDKGIHYRGTIDSIGRTGRVKINLIDSRYDTFSIGAGSLKDNLLS